MEDKIKKYNCEKCDYQTDKSGNFSRHLKTKNHIKNYKEEIEKEEEENKKKKFHCELCNFYTNNGSSYSKHKKTKKHKKNLELSKKKYINKEDFGLIYLIRLDNGNYKIGLSNKCDLDRLKSYNGPLKINKELILLSMNRYKEFEKYLKEKLYYYRFYEGITKEYFNWNYATNYQDNDNFLLEIFNDLLLLFSIKC
jgi:hypothetical protein